MKSKYFIFDLDDTIVNEVDYLKSAYREIALSIGDCKIYESMLEWYFNGEDVFDKLSIIYTIDKTQLLNAYRSHIPTLILNDGIAKIFAAIKFKGNFLGLITDGRSVTQRNKLRALAIESIFDLIIISEEFGSSKPNSKNYEIFHNEFCSDYFYIGDNVTKDFISPNKLGWQTVCLLDKGENVHNQNFDLPQEFMPNHKIKDITELLAFI